MKKKDLQDNFLVQKSRPLFDLWISGFSLIEFKLLDVYLSKINSHNVLNRTVTFDRKELCEILGVTELKVPELAEHLKQLHSTTVALDIDNDFWVVTLFSSSRVINDEYGVCKLEMTCTEEAIRFFFNIEQNYGYIKYKINAVTHIKSLYSYLMFMYIEYNRFRKTWEVPVDDLKRFLNCATVESYKDFRFFNREILKKTQKELSEKANCIFEYETVKRGRTITHIRFTAKPMIVDDIIFTDNEQENIIETERPEIIDRLNMACQYKFNTFIDTIYNLVSTSCIPNYIKGDTDEDKQYYFVYQTYQKFLVQEKKMTAKRKNITNRFEYFYKMLENEIKKANTKKAEQQQQPKKREPSYDINEFEKFAVTLSKNTKSAATEEPTFNKSKEQTAEQTTIDTIPTIEPQEEPTTAAELTKEDIKNSLNDLANLDGIL